MVAIVSASLLIVFSIRKADRLDRISEFCFKGTNICHDTYFGSDYNDLGFGVVMLTRYLTQGFHGLAIAFDYEQFESGYGFGHSRPLYFLAGKLFELESQTLLTDQLDELGWASRGLWTTAFVWLGNDIPLFFTPLLIFLFSVILAYCVREAKQ